MSVRLRLTLWHTALLALVLAAFAALVYVTVSRQVESEVDHDIDLRALQAAREVIAVTVGRPVGPGRVRPVDLPTSALVDTSLYVQIVGANGEVVSRSNNLTEPLPIPPETLRLALAGQEIKDRLPFQGGRIQMQTAPLTVDSNVVGVLQVAAPLQASDGRLSVLRLVLAAVVPLTVCAAAGVLLNEAEKADFAQ